MKLKSLILGLSAAALMGGSAAQANTLYIVGSTAYRPAATAAIIAYCRSKGGSVTATFNASAGSSNSATITNIFKASKALFVSGDGTLSVYTNWTGSAAGIIDLVAGADTSDTFINGTSAAPTTLDLPGILWFPQRRSVSTR